MINWRLVDISHVNKEKSSLTISIPKKVAEILDVKYGDVIAFKLNGSEISIEVIK